jgi:hypothetical protein
MITVMLQGGLGNQLFQICAAMYVAHNTGQMCVFTDRHELGRGAETKRQTYWDTPLFAPGSLQTTNIDRYPWAIWRESSFKYSPIEPEPQAKHTMLVGYFQSPYYFNNACIDRLKGGALRQIGLNKKDAISLHFRIGDYRRVEHVHPIMTVDYYARALEHIVAQTRQTRVCVFGEEADEAEIMAKVASLQTMFPGLVFEMEPWLLPDWQQMIDMSQCTNHIIANSSFSWWGAFLDESPAIVCYPDKWFGPDVKHDTSDLFPRHWVKIQG